MRAQFLRPSYFVWILVPLIAGAVYFAWGAPHLIFSYDFRSASYDPFIKGGRYYERCTYYGPFGAFTTYPTNGRCNWLLWRR